LFEYFSERGIDGEWLAGPISGKTNVARIVDVGTLIIATELRLVSNVVEVVITVIVGLLLFGTQLGWRTN